MAPSPSSDRWQRLDQLFQNAVDLDPSARAEYLDQHCGDDADLRKEVESLLESADASGDFIERSVQRAAREIVARTDDSPLREGSAFGQYKVLRQLGAGGMGEVYLAEDIRLQRRVALKTLARNIGQQEDALRRFEQEARAASALNHPNILTIYDVGECENARYIASEYVQGWTIREMLRSGPVSLEAAVRIAAQVASGLAAAHGLGIAHRDIKPENIIVRTDGLVKIVDFGIAKLGEREGGGLRIGSHTQPGMVIGTARYMSPEQARGFKVDGRSDIFSLGTVLYEMVSGKSPFDGETDSDTIAALLRTDPQPLSELQPDVPPRLDQIVAKAMRKDLETRYSSAGHMLADLDSFRKELEFRSKLRTAKEPAIQRTPVPVPELPAVTNEPQPDATPARAKSRRRALIPLTAATIAVTAALAYWLWFRPAPAPPAARLRSLAILPFRNLKDDPGSNFLGFSLADAVTTKLASVSSLALRPSSAVDRYRNQAIDPRKVGAELDVDTLLTGTFMKDGDMLRISAQLVDMKPYRVIWEKSLDVKYQKMLMVQDEVTNEIISGLELKLSPVEAQNVKFDNAIGADGYEAYLRGVDLYSTNDFGSAIRMLEKAAQLGPGYAPTWAHLGRAYTTNASLEFGGREQYEKAQAAYERALQLNPGLIDARVYMANLFTDTGRVEQAVPLLREALRNNPNHAEAHWELGYAYRFGGLLKESAAECERARELDPQVKLRSAVLSTYLYLGEYDKFLASLPPPDTVYILFYRGFGEFYRHHDAAARENFDKAFDMDPSLLQAELGNALSLALQHRNAEGVRVLQHTESKVNLRGVTDPEGMYKIAQAYAVLGDKASALRVLRRSVDGGFFPYPYLDVDPLLNNVRKEAAFAEILARAKQRYQNFSVHYGPSGS